MMAAGVAAAGALAPRPLSAAAPMGGASSLGFRRFMIGGFEVTTIHDGYVVAGDPHDIFGQDQPKEVVHALAAENYLPTDRLVNNFTVTLVNTGSELVLFDTGNAAGRAPTTSMTRARLAAAGYTPEQVDVVVITHMHGDHIGGLMLDGAPAYPNARYVTGAAEHNFWFGGSAPEGGANNAKAMFGPLAEKASFIDPGASVVSGIEAVGAFGHSPGHMAYHIESEGQRLAITADAGNHFVLSLQRPDWHVRFDMDKAAAAATRKALFGMIAADRIPFVGYHMPFPAVGFLKAEGEGFAFVPESYQLTA
jgi:glyoxylase-like metal-dependent hydrolase (beta-lactamase superfamily II)